MSSSMRASGSSTLYWSCAKYSRNHVVPQPDGSRRGRLHAREQLDQRRLARAVDAHQRHAVAALDGESPAAEDLLRSVALRQALGLSRDAPRRRRLRKLEVNDRLLFGNFDALDLIELLDARLHLFGLRGLVAEAVDERFKVLDRARAGCDRPPSVVRGARPSAQGTWCNCPGRWSAACSRSRPCDRSSHQENSGRAK